MPTRGRADRLDNRGKRSHRPEGVEDTKMQREESDGGRDRDRPDSHRRTSHLASGTVAG